MPISSDPPGSSQPKSTRSAGSCPAPTRPRRSLSCSSKARSRPGSTTFTLSWTSMRPPATSGRTAVPVRWSRRGSSTSATSSRASRAGRSTPRTGLPGRPRGLASRGALRRRGPVTSMPTVSRHSARAGAASSPQRSSAHRPRRPHATLERPSTRSRLSIRSARHSRHPVSNQRPNRRSRVAGSRRRPHRRLPLHRTRYPRQARRQPRAGLGA